MSSQSIVNWTGNQKIYDSLLPNPYPYPAFPSTLAQTLLAGDDAGNQDIENLRQLDTSIITQQDALLGSFLSIGGLPNTPLAGGFLKIQGATAKGSLLVGDGTYTTELPVPAPALPNGSVLILDSAAPLGVRWGGESGDINSITPGNNIDITGPTANPIVAFQSPTTSNILLGVGTEIQAKDNYSSPNFAMSLDATGFNDKYDVGGVVNQEDIAVSSTGVIQTISATDGSTYTNTDITSVSNTGVSEVITAGNASTQYTSINTLITGTSTASTTTNIDVGGTYNNTITEGTTTTASYATYQALDTTNTNYGQVNIATNLSSNSASVSAFSSGIPSPPFPAPNASISIGCADPTNPNISLGQSTPFQPSYSTIINKDGINQNNSSGTGFNLQTAQDLTLTCPVANKIIVPNGNDIDLSTTGGGGQVFTTEYKKSGYNAQDFIAGNYSGQVQAFTSGGSSQMFISSSNLASASTQYLRLESTFGGDMNIEHNATAGRNLAITTTNNLTLGADNIDLSATGRLIVPTLAGGDYLDYNPATANLTLATNNTGGGANPMLTLNQNDTNAGACSLRLFKNSSTSGVGIGEVSFQAKDAGGTQREYARVNATIRNTGSGNQDGSVSLQALVNNTLTECIRVNGVDSQTEFLQPIDMNNNAITTGTGNLTLTCPTAGGAINLTSTSNVNVTATGDNLTTISGANTTISTTGVGTQIEFKPETTAGKIVFTGAALQSNTSGANSGEHLVITLNGNVYKIRLELP